MLNENHGISDIRIGNSLILQMNKLKSGEENEVSHLKYILRVYCEAGNVIQYGLCLPVTY